MGGMVFELGHYAFKFGDQAVGAGAEDVENGAVIPESAFAAPSEAGEDRLAVEAEVGDDGADVVEFVSSGDEVDVVVGVSEVG
jgi:hypothetical protein